MSVCQHTQVFEISGKCGDLCSWQFPNGERGRGEVPSIKGLGGGDYLRLRVCLLCREVLGLGTEGVDEILRLQDEAEPEE